MEEKVGDVSLDLEGTKCQAKGFGLDPVSVRDWESGRWATGIVELHGIPLIVPVLLSQPIRNQSHWFLSCCTPPVP